MPPLSSISAEEKRRLLRGLVAERARSESASLLTEAQRRLWELEAHESAVPGMHVFGIRYRLRGQVSAAVLKQALEAVAARHPALRVRITEGPDGVPRFAPAAGLDIQITDRAHPVIDGLAMADSEEAIARVAATPIDLARHAGWRALILAGSAETDLLLQLHHICADRWSVGVIARDVSAAYRSLIAGGTWSEPEAWPPQPVAPEELSRQLAYWDAAFAEPGQPIELPMRKAGGAHGSYAGSRISSQVDSETTAHISTAAVHSGGTPFAYLLAGFAATIHRHTGQERFVIATPMTGRHRPGTRNVVSYLNNIVPVKVDLSGDPTLAELAEQIAAEARTAAANQDAPFQRIAELPVAACLGLTRCLFAVQNIRGLNLDLENVASSYEDVGNGTANFDLALFLEERDGALAAMLDYKTGAFEAQSAQLIWERTLEIYRRMGQSPSIRLSQLPSWQSSEGRGAKAAAEAIGAPASPIEGEMTERMVALWQRVFPREMAASITPSSDFFLLGGDSILAQRLFARIRTEFGLELPLATLFQAPSPSAVVARMMDRQWVPPWMALVPLRETGSRPPLFCIAAGGGNVLSYQSWLPDLDAEQPVYCLQARGLRNEDVPFDTVEEIATSYLDAIRSVRPHGPYFLTGHSLGALVAYEMAVRLTAAGEEVPLVAVLDSPGPDAAMRKADIARYHWTNISTLPWTKRVSYVYGSAKWFVQTRVARRFPKLTRTSNPQVSAGRLAMLDASLRALSSYCYPQYAGRVVIFRAKQPSPRMMADPKAGWGRVATGEVTSVEVPGTHLSMMKEPYVHVLGRALETELCAIAGQIGKR